MANITGGWNKNMPSGSSLISEGDDLMRQHWRSLQSTLNDEHYFSDSKKSAGLHKTGSARIFVGPASQRSSKPTAQDVIPGRVYFERETGDMYALGSTETKLTYGGGVCLHDESGTVLGDVSNKDLTRFDEIHVDWGPTSGNTWAVLSNGSVKYVTVPSGLSGYFKIDYDLTMTYGAGVAASGADVIVTQIQKNGLSLMTKRIGPPAYSIHTVWNINANAIIGAKSGDTIRVRSWCDQNIAAAERAGSGSLSIYKVG